MMAQPLFAEGAPFSVATPLTPEIANAGEESTIALLKRQAISEWLQAFLGNRYSQFERSIDKDFAERYILNYSVNHPATTPPQIVVSGQLDADGLKKWIRIAENRSRSNSSGHRTLCLLSSQIPGQNFSSSESLTKSKDSVLGAQLHQIACTHLAKLGGAVVVGQSGAPAGSPPGAANQFRDLKEYAQRQGANLAVWAHIIPCPQCVGSRIEMNLYDLGNNRVAATVSEDLPIHPKDTSNAELLKSQLAPVATQFQTELERLVAEGTLASREYSIVIEGVTSYRALKGLEQLLQQQSYLSDPVLKRSSVRVAEFKVLSALPVDELVAKIRETDFQGRRLTASKIDSGSVVAQIR